MLPDESRLGYDSMQSVPVFHSVHRELEKHRFFDRILLLWTIN